MARPRTPIGTFGDISFIKATGGQVRARTRYRDDDGKVRRVSATGVTKREAERNLKKMLAERTSYRSTGELSPDSSFTALMDVWLADLDLEAKIAESTRALYERNMRQLVLPVFEGYALREITASKVDRQGLGDDRGDVDADETGERRRRGRGGQVNRPGASGDCFSWLSRLA